MTPEQRRLYGIDTPDEWPEDAPDEMRLGAGLVLVFAAAVFVGIAAASYALSCLIGGA